MNYNNLLILERSSSTLVADAKSGDYVLEGIFGEIDKKNKNNRIYTESEYLPQIEALQEKIKSSKLLGELDHPAKFDVSLKNVSHIIEELYYDNESKQVRGKIRLLDTDAGRQAKALVDAGVPLQISSRAAGEVSEGGQVKIKQLFTYDLVADPGFANAELNRVNESFGFDADSNIQIFQINDTENLVTETETIENQNNTNTIMENQARFVSVEDFNKYSAYLAEEIKTLKESLANNSTEGVEEKLEALTNYVEHVAERADKGIQYTEYIAERADRSIQYTEYIAENLDKSIDYSNYVAEKLDNSISYTEHVAEAAGNIKEYANYLAEAMNEGAADYENVTKYLNYLKENVESVSEYADYIAETINTNLIMEEEVNDGDDKTGTEAEDLKADLKEVDNDVEAPEDKSAELEADLDKEAAPAKEVAESDIKVNDGDDKTGVEADELKSDAKEVNNDVEAPEDKSKELEADLDKEATDSKVVVEAEEEATEEAAEEEAVEEKEEAAEEAVEETEETVEETCDACGANPCECVSEEVEDKSKELMDELEDEVDDSGEEVDVVEAYKNEISEKLSALINKATVKENNNPHFFRLVSESTQNKYNELEEADKAKVLASIEGRGYLTESQINTLMESALVEVAGQNVPYFIEAMPSEYKDTWAKLSEAKKSAIAAQAKMVKLTSPYQVKNFWETRDLRETTPVMEKVEMINEAKKLEAPKSSTITYNTDGMAEALAARFKK